jgi:membrane fusion protein (multidrug efflux system)
VTAGLTAGDKVITQGLGNLRPTSAIHAVPEKAPQAARAGGRRKAA